MQPAKNIYPCGGAEEGLYVMVKKADGCEAPQRQTPGSAGFDLQVAEDTVIAPNTIVLVPTGISVAIPDGFVGKVYARSSLPKKYRLMLPNSVGVIDSDYRGEIFVQLYNFGTVPIVLHKGDRIAQLVIEPYAHNAVLFEVDELDETERGAGGFGSTGR